MKKIILFLIIGFLYSCNNHEPQIHNPNLKVDNLKIKAIKFKGSCVTLIVNNTQGKPFAYAEMSQTQTAFEPMIEQIRFSKTSCDTIETIGNSKIVFYEFKEDKYGKLMLKPQGRIPYVIESFKIN